ncbi:MAG: Spermidine synthase-like protein [uncultured Thermomicrobiales bacterium]|uniref:Spermidine synthase-like protein n=1 Tax=uncultured Thermomicrobiales bacterium TaxID=1645740 RepID=A0A6J4UMY6_9BACT|nr:MAG: Spermidine synthase-like protein [uncultured Thermomicrobiales bacterium]
MTDSPSRIENAALSRHDDLFIRLIVFLGGMTSVGTELSVSRLIAPFFGDSTFIWANLIGLTLTFLAIGYWLGGRAADRYPRLWVLYSITAAAALWCALLPFLARPILEFSLDAFDQVAVGAFYGSLLGVLLILSVPITLLGFVSPYAIRLRIANVTQAGHTSGNIYALGTVGSIAGSFLPVLVLIPWVGTVRTFLILGALLFIPSAIGLLRLRAIPQVSAMAIGATMVALLVTLNIGGPIRPAQGGELIYETESRDNYIQVVQDGTSTELSLNEGHATHSIYDPAQPLTRGPWDYFMVAPLFNRTPSTAQIDNALLIGLAGGTVSKQLTAAYGPIPIDGVEIDPEIAAVGREYFGMTEPNLNVIVEDGRYVLRTTDTTYDLIGVDAYKQPYIPFQLTTREFFQEVSGQLTPQGVAVINVGRTETDYRLVDVIASTMKDVFPNVYVIDTEFYANSIVIGTNSPTELANFSSSVNAQPADSLVRTVGESSIATGNVREVTEVTRVFTDDHAPVERVVDQIIIDAAREENAP